MDTSLFLKGALSGMVGVALSHPCDTIKNNIQTNKPVQYNFRFLYKGFKLPFLFTGLEKAVVFSTQKNVNSYLTNLHNPILNPTLCTAISGGVAGLCASFVVTPCEGIKTILQTSQKQNKEIINFKCLHKGFFATTTREIPGFAVYFTMYELIEKKYCNGKCTIPQAFLAGSISGASAWLLIFPQDKIKTIIQSGVVENQSYSQIFKSIKKKGVFELFRGVEWALLRAMILHGGTFATMNILQRNL